MTTTDTAAGPRAARTRTGNDMDELTIGERWWICTGSLTGGGQKILGPFGSRDLALEVRVYVEAVKAPETYWVDSEATPDEPHMMEAPR